MRYFLGVLFSMSLVVFLSGCEKEVPQKEIIRSVRAIKVASPEDFEIGRAHV